MHYDRVSHVSYELCIMHLHYALGVHIVCCVMYYVLCITTECHITPMNYVFALRTGSPHIVCYVLCITYYVLRTGSPHRMLCIMHCVLCIMYDVDRRDGAQPQRARF